MGQEVLYCYKCQRRVVGTDFSKGHAFEVGNHVSCSACAADLLQNLSSKDREQLLGKMFQATQGRHAASAPAAAPKRQSTVRLPAVPPPPRKPSPMLPVLIGGGLLLVAILILMFSRSDPPKPEPPRAATLPPQERVPVEKSPAADDLPTRRQEAIAKERAELQRQPPPPPPPTPVEVPPPAPAVIFSHDFAKGAGSFKSKEGATEIVDAEPGGPKAIAIGPKGAGVRDFKVVTRPSTVVRFRLKPLVDVDWFECMSWVEGKGANAWYHVPNLKKGVWRTVEFKLGELRLNYNGTPIMGATVNTLFFYFLDRPDDARVLLADFEIRD